MASTRKWILPALCAKTVDDGIETVLFNRKRDDR